MQNDTFTIEGKWKNIGTEEYGQVQIGSLLVFDGMRCNLYSPSDTYAFYKDGNSYRLDLKSLLWGQDINCEVIVKDKNNIEIHIYSSTLILKRVQ